MIAQLNTVSATADALATSLLRLEGEGIQSHLTEVARSMVRALATFSADMIPLADQWTAGNRTGDQTEALHLSMCLATSAQNLLESITIEKMRGGFEQRAETSRSSMQAREFLIQSATTTLSISSTAQRLSSLLRRMGVAT